MDKQKRQDIIIKTCCVIAALVLWMYISSTENPISTQLIKYVPVEVLNLDTLEDKDLVALPNQEFYVNINVKATDSILRNIDKDKDFKLQVDIRDYALKAGENRVPVTVKESPIGASILNPDGLILKIDVDTLFQITMETGTNVIGKVAEGFHIGEVTMNPNSVKVAGPEKLIKNIKSIIADINVTNASKDIEKVVQLKALDGEGKEIKNVKIYPDVSQVNAKINKGRALDVNVKTKGILPSGFTLKNVEAIPKTIEIAGMNDAVNKLKTIDTEPIDLSSIYDDTLLEVDLVLPQEVQLVNKNQKVKVKITVNKSMEKKVSIPIKYINLSDDLRVDLKDTLVNLTIYGDKSILEKITVDTVTATIDLDGLREGEHNVEIKLSGLSDNLKILSQDISKANVIIKNISEEGSNNGG